MKKFANVILYVFLIIIMLLCLIPFYSMLISSTHDNTSITTKLLVLPSNNFLDNYARLTQTINVWRGFLNSAIIAISSTTLTLYFSALVAYGFSKFQFYGRDSLFAFVVATMMIPGQLGIIGFYKLMNDIGLINSYIPLIIPSIANAFGIFFMKQMCDTAVPNEIIEASYVDGCGELKLFNSIVLPMLLPALAALGILSFIGAWNSFLMPLIILIDNSLQPLPVMIASVRTQFTADYGAQYVGILISVMPIIIIFSISSRWIMNSVSIGAVKG
ncbi:carbohydrate ABC transporter permease [Mahella australiensis]|uniref:Binding-protein-dependent transport systems inner membrane component n=1 Tax=Mahella australiensis (strain DSM 15567 / CIP 107919 / 50-1 BON) TaxID=697281 RepID=F4A265_MAHA5|nr:carbohydrate ABC transporter permease [Mahella australiensis]AEE97204.1 binding-protein-dependent transport systems inner membrane component [Mahella australiensis 50-1 BON]